MFIELFMAATLDLSLPEFQPEKDISGNYIELSTDVSTGDVVVNELTQEEFDSSVSDNLPVLDSKPADPTQRTNNEINLRSVPNGTFYSIYPNSSDNFSNLTVSIVNDTVTVNGTASYTARKWSTLLSAGTYTVSFDNVSGVGSVRLGKGVSTSGAPTQILFITQDGYQTITLDSDMYICLTFPDQTSYSNFTFRIWANYGSSPVAYPSGSGGDDPGSDPSGNEPSYDIDLTNLENLVSDIKNINNDSNEKFRIILFICLMNFCLPFLINGLRLVMGGKNSNV